MNKTLKPFEREMYLLGTDLTNAVLGTSGNDSIDRAFEMLMERVQPLAMAGEAMRQHHFDNDWYSKNWDAAFAKLREK